jgi:hypothetical protein
MNLCGRVVSHDEVVAVSVLHLVDGDGTGQGEDAPVREASHDTTIAENERTDSIRDPR